MYDALALAVDGPRVPLLDWCLELILFIDMYRQRHAVWYIQVVQEAGEISFRIYALKIADASLLVLFITTNMV